MKRYVEAAFFSFLLAFFANPAARPQASAGPLAPVPGTPIQQAPPQTKLQIQVSLVNTPVTVRNSKGEMVHDLDESDFRITDNGIPQKIVHFDLGGDPISLVVLVETSSHIAPLLPQLRKTGILLTQTVMGPTGEGAIISFNDEINKIQDFTTSADTIEQQMAHLQAGTSGLRLYDAMAAGIEMLTSRRQATADASGRRRVMLILSETADRGSQAKFGEVLRAAQLANVTIYSAVFRFPARLPLRKTWARATATAIS
jgi:VWFA-related protein